MVNAIIPVEPLLILIIHKFGCAAEYFIKRFVIPEGVQSGRLPRHTKLKFPVPKLIFALFATTIPVDPDAAAVGGLLDRDEHASYGSGIGAA